MEENNVPLRVALDVLLAVSVIFGWWYVALPVGILAAWACPYYAELILAGFMRDALFGMGRGMGIAGYLGLIVSIILTLALSLAKYLLR